MWALSAFWRGSSRRSKKLIQIRKEKKASEIFVEECGHPTHAGLNLKVTVVSGCDGFKMAEAA
jgi:hypothetical protein